MGYLKDLGTGTVESVCEVTGYPKDRWGRLLDPINPREDRPVKDWDKSGTELYNLTSPYGHLQWAVGNGDDFWCFDYAVLNNCKDFQKRIVLDATINSETGGFIEGGGYEVVIPEPGMTLASDVAFGMIDSALDWVAEPTFCVWSGKYKNMRHGKKGWNQDPFYFARCVAITEANILGVPVPDFSEKQKRFGGKRIEKFLEEIRKVA